MDGWLENKWKKLYVIKSKRSSLAALVNIWSGALMHQLNQSSCGHVGITCLFEHVATSRDSLQMDRWTYHCHCQPPLPLNTDFCCFTFPSFACLPFTWGEHIFAELSLCLVSVGTRAAPSAAGSATAMAKARRTSVQRSSTPAPPSTPSRAHPWDPDATLLLWWAEIQYRTGCDNVLLAFVLFILWKQC